MLIDDVIISVSAGRGGDGKASDNGHGPDGGTGGRGGHVYVQVTSDLTALNQFSGQKKVTASDGHPGMKKRSHGKNGSDVILTLPIGCSLKELKTGRTLELTGLDQKNMICRGGRGGRGNFDLKKDYYQPGELGQSKDFHIVLRYIADYGLIGLPNAGKSSLLNVLTNAKAVTGAYPFTTLEANLGAFGKTIIADIPGLIEGASAGRGLGVGFLKHIEKVKMLLHCISVESDDVLSDFNTINEELKKYNPELLTKNRVILLTKTDLTNDKMINDQMAKLKTVEKPVFLVSIYDPKSIDAIKNLLS